MKTISDVTEECVEEVVRRLLAHGFTAEPGDDFSKYCVRKYLDLPALTEAERRSLANYPAVTIRDMEGRNNDSWLFTYRFSGWVDGDKLYYFYNEPGLASLHGMESKQRLMQRLKLFVCLWHSIQTEAELP